MNIWIKFVSAAVVTLACGAAAHGQHGGDVALVVSGGRIVTGTFDDMGNFVGEERVFGAEFGELFPGFTDEPGFDSAAGTFVPGSVITFDVLSAVREWDGIGFGAIPDERIQIGFGPLPPVTTPLTDMIVPGFGLAVGVNGQFHRHLEYTLLSPAETGVYLLELSLRSDQMGIGSSLPFYVVFNQGSDEAEHDAAIEWVRTNVIPAPGVGVALMGALLAFRRTR